MKRASFWKGPGVNPKEVQTEVFQLPCASSVEKEGSITNSSRLAQWRYKAAEPMGEARSDSDIMNELYFRVKKLYQKKGGKFPEPILNLTWDYGKKGPLTARSKNLILIVLQKRLTGITLKTL